MLPLWGAITSIQIAASLLLLGAALIWWSGSHGRRMEVWAFGLALGLLLFIQPKSLDYDKLSTGANVYFADQAWGRVIDHAESLDGGLTLVTQNSSVGRNVKFLLTNGKFQGSDATSGEMKAQLGFALAPLLHVPRREQALVIGYGTGVTARALKMAEFGSLDVVDLSQDIVTLANRHFAIINDRVTGKPGVRTFYTDGRNFLLLGDRKYDLISMEISSIWFAGASALYNREFYQLARKRLSSEGALQQWVQLHHLSPTDIAYILGSVRAEFDHVWLYIIGDQGVIVASTSPVRREHALDKAAVPPRLAALMGQTGLTGEQVSQSLRLDPEGVDALLDSFGIPREFLVSTDDNLELEYSTPKGNALDSGWSYFVNMNFIGQFSSAGKTR
jgi:spermidine synthase